MKQIEQIFAQIDVSLREKISIPPDDLKRVIGRGLTRGLAEAISKEIDSLPVVYTVEEDKYVGGESHTIRLNLISDEEIKRLRMIERAYSEISLYGDMFNTK